MWSEWLGLTNLAGRVTGPLMRSKSINDSLRSHDRVGVRLANDPGSGVHDSPIEIAAAANYLSIREANPHAVEPGDITSNTNERGSNPHRRNRVRSGEHNFVADELDDRASLIDHGILHFSLELHHRCHKRGSIDLLGECSEADKIGETYGVFLQSRATRCVDHPCLFVGENRSEMAADERCGGIEKCRQRCVDQGCIGLDSIGQSGRRGVDRWLKVNSQKFSGRTGDAGGRGANDPYDTEHLLFTHKIGQAGKDPGGFKLLGREAQPGTTLESHGQPEASRKFFVDSDMI